MQTPIRTIVPGLVLAFSATAAHAGPEAATARPTDVAAGQPAPPIAPAAPPAATKPTAPPNPALPPPGATPAALMGPPVDPIQGAPAPVKEVVNWISRSRD